MSRTADRYYKEKSPEEKALQRERTLDIMDPDSIRRVVDDLSRSDTIGYYDRGFMVKVIDRDNVDSITKSKAKDILRRIDSKSYEKDDGKTEWYR